eukprot:m.100521 g.100521  ORF g.100521 m.100521 type:complete len:1343 (+) comp22232_c0_seq2:1212-5240(+)
MGIAPSVDFAPNLRNYSIRYNAITALPSFQFNRKLENFDAQGTNLSFLPNDLFANATQLRTLILADCRLTQVPDLNGLENLQHLSLSNNTLNTIPNLTMGNLHTLIMSFNPLVNSTHKNTNSKTNDNPKNNQTGVLFLPRLQMLDLSHCQLETIDHDFFKHVKQLEFLALNHNCLSTLPASLFNLTRLTLLNLGTNRLQEVTGDWSVLGRSLQEVFLSNNSLNDLPPSFSSMTQLRDLELRNNQLRVLPKLDGNSALTRLILTNNSLTSLFGNDFSTTALTELTLDQNQLVELPINFYRLKHLELLFLGSNDIGHLITEELANLTRLEYLDLSNIGLSRVPPTVGKLTALKFVGLNNNKLAFLPESIAQWSHVEQLYLFQNSLTSLPSGFSAGLSSLNTLVLDGNLITNLPSTFGPGLHNLEILSLSNNPLTAFPSADNLMYLPNLELLDLVSTALTSLPASISVLKNLVRLRFSHTAKPSISHLPSWVSRLPKLINLDVSSTGLTELPSFLRNMTSLTALHSSGNRLRTVDGLWLPPKLQILSLARNEIQAVVNLDNLTAFQPNSELLGILDMTDNPTVCELVLEPASSATRVICSCGDGLLTLKQPDRVVLAETVVPLSLVGSRNHGILEFKSNLLQTQYQQFNILEMPSSLEVQQNPLNSVREIWLKFKDVNVPDLRVRIGLVDSAFYRGTDGSTQPRVQLPHVATSTLTKNVTLPIPLSVALQTNAYMATNVRYHVVSGVLPEGVQLHPFTGLISGTPEYSGQYAPVMINATEMNTNEVRQAAQLTLVVTDCGDGVCHNGGTCDDKGNPFDNKRSCNCMANFTGDFCEVALEPGKTSIKLQGLSTGTIVGITVGSIFCVSLFAFGLIRYWRSRLPRKSQSFGITNPLYPEEVDADTIRCLKRAQDFDSLKHKSDEDFRKQTIAWENIASSLEANSLGQGAFGKVFKVIWERSEGDRKVRILAVAKIPRNPKFKFKEFYREAFIMAQLSCGSQTNIVRLYGVITKKHQANALVMEFCSEGSFPQFEAKRKRNNQSLSPLDRLQLVLHVCQGLEYLGEPDVNCVHGDLHAGNILVHEDHQQYHAKIGDFGLARQLHGKKSKDSFTQEMKVDWAAPEVRQRGEFSHASDCYSFGVTVCEMFGNDPFDTDYRGRLADYRKNLSAKYRKDVCNPPPTPQVPQACERVGLGPVLKAAFSVLPENRWVAERMCNAIKEIHQQMENTKADDEKNLSHNNNEDNEVNAHNGDNGNNGKNDNDYEHGDDDDNNTITNSKSNEFQLRFPRKDGYKNTGNEARNMGNEDFVVELKLLHSGTKTDDDEIEAYQSDKENQTSFAGPQTTTKE